MELFEALVTNVIIWRLPTFSCGEVSWRKWGIYYQGDCVCRDTRLCRHRPGCVNLSFVSSQHGHSIVLVRCITSETKHDPWSIPYHPKALFLDTSYTSTQQLESELLMSVTKSKSWWGWGQRSVCWTNPRPRKTRLGHDKWQHWSCASSSGSGGAGAGVRTRPPRHHRPVCTGPAVSRALVPGLDQDPLLFVTTDNVRRCGDRGDTSELELQRSLESDANMWQTDIMKNLQLIFSVYLLSEVVSMIDKRVINNKNSENNEGINDFMYFLVVSLKTMTTYFPVGIIYRIIKRQ